MSPPPENPVRGDNLILIGARGSGKTVVGRALAARLGRPFVDTDERIEQRAGCTIMEIFGGAGEGHFRELERAMIAEVTAGGGQVISVGGGAVLREDNRTRLHRAGRCVWLAAPPDVLAARLRSDPRSATLRPALTGADPDAEIRRVLAERVRYYQSLADDRIETTGLSVAQVVEAVVGLAWP